MKNPIRTATAIKSLANYLPENEATAVATSYSPDREIRRRKIRAVREELDNLSSCARQSMATYFQFQIVLDQIHSLGAAIPDDLVSDIRGALFEA